MGRQQGSGPPGWELSLSVWNSLQWRESYKMLHKVLGLVSGSLMGWCEHGNGASGSMKAG